MEAIPRIARALACAALLLGAAGAAAEELRPVGLRRIAFADQDRRIALTLFHPAAPTAVGRRFAMPFFTDLGLIEDVAPDGASGRRPLVMLSHGRGSNGLLYAWFGQYLAARGYVVAAIDHWRANSWDSHIAYLANRLWQRPVDIGLAISFLLDDPTWGPAIDPERIGVAGHSQGGFTALWIGGAAINAERYGAFQRGWRNNAMVPGHLRADLPLDPAPALEVCDRRVKAAFAMAPGVIQAFGMDAAGLAGMTIPAFLIVGARDTQTPPGPNAAFAARHIPGAELMVIPGPVDHEIFVNECDQEGRDEFPAACIDAPGVDRAAIHQMIGRAAAAFFDRALGVAPR